VIGGRPAALDVIEHRTGATALARGWPTPTPPESGGAADEHVAPHV